MADQTTEISCTGCGDTDGPFERRPDGSHRCEGCIKKAAS